MIVVLEARRRELADQVPIELVNSTDCSLQNLRKRIRLVTIPAILGTPIPGTPHPIPIVTPGLTRGPACSGLAKKAAGPRLPRLRGGRQVRGAAGRVVRFSRAKTQSRKDAAGLAHCSPATVPRGLASGLDGGFAAGTPSSCLRVNPSKRRFPEQPTPCAGLPSRRRSVITPV